MKVAELKTWLQVCTWGLRGPRRRRQHSKQTTLTPSGLLASLLPYTQECGADLSNVIERHDLEDLARKMASKSGGTGTGAGAAPEGGA